VSGLNELHRPSPNLRRLTLNSSKYGTQNFASTRLIVLYSALVLNCDLQLIRGGGIPAISSFPSFIHRPNETAHLPKIE
jgi:hypothetical protein